MEGNAVKIGFVGLGNMGFPMASNLLEAGYSVTCFDIAQRYPDGARPAESAADAAESNDIVITMLPNGTALRSVADETIPAMRRGATFVDCSTVDMASALAVAEKTEAAGLKFVDAPVSGGVAGATGGNLTFMAGGTDEAFRFVLPLFEIMGSKAVHCGNAGAGQAAKMCNNMILGATMIVSCEAFALADALGLDRQKLFEVVSKSSGYSWSMNAYCPAPGVGPNSPSDNDYTPGFASDLMLKDLRLAQSAAADSGVDTPVGNCATEFYRKFVEEQNGSGLDFSAVLKVLAKNSVLESGK